MANLIKLLVITGDDKLVEFSSTCQIGKILATNVGGVNCSSFALVGKCVYCVGGCENIHSLYSKVEFYNINDENPQSLTKYQAPFLISPKFQPKLIVLGSKLFAFSWQFFCSSSSTILIESPPIVEFLDTSFTSNRWRPVPSFPSLPSPSSNRLPCYSVVAFAAHTNLNTLFLSFGHPIKNGLYSVSYNESTEMWSSLLPSPLPFAGKGKFFDDTCFGFPIGMHTHDRDYISCFKFSIDWDQTRTITWVTMATYSLASNSLLNSYPSFFSFFPLTSCTLATVRVRALDMSSESLHRLEVELLHLLPIKLEKKRRLKGHEEDFYLTEVHSSSCYPLEHNLQDILGVYW
ncbi:hypothetical protein vseg_009104 [Gypsophila vaccaria]